MSRPLHLFLLLSLACPLLRAHAPPTPIPVPPLHVQGNRLIDATRAGFLLRGVNMPGLEAAAPTPADLAAVQTMNAHTFRVIQQRWNMNAVRLPVSVWLWKRDGAPYLDRIAAVVAAANSEGLVAVLAAYDDSHAGAPSPTGLPGVELPGFWKACAQRFQATPDVIFALYNEPSARGIPGAPAGSHRPQDWQVWRNGGPLTGGLPAVGMQTLVDTIRGAGAAQIIAAPAFYDALEFQGFGPDTALNDPNILYETHPSFDHGLTDEARDANFGLLSATLPVYVGSWGMPFGQPGAACQSIPADVAQATDLLFQISAYFDRRSISWTAADFRPGSLIQEFTDDTATQLSAGWTCDARSDPRLGIGAFLLLYLTGDPAGFGSLDPTQIASAAGGFAGPVSAGQIIAVFGQLIGPSAVVQAGLDAGGRAPLTLGDVQVFFDGRPAPLFMAGAFEVTVQVPWEVAGQTSTSVQLVYREVASNRVQLQLVETAPGLFTLDTIQAAVLNEDGSVNGRSNPALRGSVVSFFATGCGPTEPALATGAAAGLPPALTVLPVTVRIGDRTAELLYAGAAPGLVGTMQFNVRVPDVTVAGTDRVPVTATVGKVTSRDGVTLWVR